MFPKTLLLLAVCFQVLRTGNSAMHKEEIQGGWPNGKSVNVKIESSSKKPICKMYFKVEQRDDTGNWLLVWFIGSQGRFIVRSYVYGQVQKTDFDEIEIANPIIVNVMAEENSWKITYQGKDYFHAYEFPKEDIKYMNIECNDEITVTSTWSEAS